MPARQMEMLGKDTHLNFCERQGLILVQSSLLAGRSLGLGWVPGFLHPFLCIIGRDLSY